MDKWQKSSITYWVFVAVILVSMGFLISYGDKSKVNQRTEQEIRQAQKGDLIVLTDPKGIATNILVVIVPAGSGGYDLRAQSLMPIRTSRGYVVENLARVHTHVVSRANTLVYGEVLAEYFSRY